MCVHEYNLDVDCTFGIRGITGARGLSLRFLYGESYATGKLKSNKTDLMHGFL